MTTPHAAQCHDCHHWQLRGGAVTEPKAQCVRVEPNSDANNVLSVLLMRQAQQQACPFRNVDTTDMPDAYRSQDLPHGSLLDGLDLPPTAP